METSFSIAWFSFPQQHHKKHCFCFQCPLWLSWPFLHVYCITTRTNSSLRYTFVLLKIDMVNFSAPQSQAEPPLPDVWQDMAITALLAQSQAHQPTLPDVFQQELAFAAFLEVVVCHRRLSACLSLASLHWMLLFMFNILKFLGRCMSCCWHFRAGEWIWNRWR